MPVEFQVWRIEGTKARAMPAVGMPNERRLEDLLTNDIDILGLGVMIVGRQVPTRLGGFIDLLAIDAEGTVYVIELKRARTPREVVAQVLDYASWVRSLTYEDVKEVFDRHGLHGDVAFEQAYAAHFDAAPNESLNENHRLVIVASKLDPSTERIVSYLSEDYGVPINAVFFRYFHDGDTGGEYLARSWLIPPNEIEAKASRAAGKRPPWNGHDYYVTFGPADVRVWDDGRKYGFVSASGGPRWIKPLQKLSRDDRVFVHSPGHGYVGVGLVRDPAVPITEFQMDDGTPLLELPLQSPGLDLHIGNPDAVEHVVRVDWIHAVPEDDAFWETGMFALPTSCCQLRQPFTLQRLAEHFNLPAYEDTTPESSD